MRRVTAGTVPSGHAAGDAAQLIGDAARIGALASILDPAAVWLRSPPWDRASTPTPIRPATW